MPIEKRRFGNHKVKSVSYAKKYDVAKTVEPETNCCVAIEKPNKDEFETEMNKYLSKGYKISSSACNSSNWKAILEYRVE